MGGLGESFFFFYKIAGVFILFLFLFSGGGGFFCFRAIIPFFLVQIGLFFGGVGEAGGASRQIFLFCACVGHLGEEGRGGGRGGTRRSRRDEEEDVGGYKGTVEGAARASPAGVS